MLEEQRQEPRKRKKIGTLQGLKTAVSGRLHSKPRNEGQEFLDLWSLKLNRARWAKAGEQAREKLEAIDRAIAKLGLSEAETASHEPHGPHVGRTIDFNIPGSARR
ncbi:unnamed protein product [marine sediment metagenome]|uniref:Uncharacterized protein n=1 Tax=marine sediment metagenome TaxID=412755 RepID=X0YDW4_9ZZZZ